MGGHYSTRAQRMDLLDDLRQKTGNAKGARRARRFGTERRNAPPLLLARLPSPLKLGGGACLRRQASAPTEST